MTEIVALLTHTISPLPCGIRLETFYALASPVTNVVYV